MSTPDSSSDPQLPPQSWRTTASLILFMHLFFVVVALAANRNPSLLLSRILVVARPYTQLLNIDLDNSGYHLTHDTYADIDHLVEVLPAGGDESDESDWQIVLPPDTARVSLPYKRHQRFAVMMEYFREEEDQIGSLARAICQRLLDHSGEAPIAIRCRRHIPVTRDMLAVGTPAERDPFHAMHYEQIYRADVIVDRGLVQVVRRVGSGEEATTEAGPSRGTDP